MKEEEINKKVKDRVPFLKSKEYDKLIDSIGYLLEKSRKQVRRSINNILIKTYWNIGKRIVDYEQGGGEKAVYGTNLLTKLSMDLRLRYGKGFSKSNVYLMRLIYIKYPKFQTVSGKLSWSHYVELLSISDDIARNFYEKQCIKENWSVRELRRQINSIGIILAAEKDNLLVEYALGGISNKLFVSRYKLYLPPKEELQNRLKYLLEQK